jgi:NAD-dependent deacetylase
MSYFYSTFNVIDKKENGMKKIVVLSGAGMSQESGIMTFRDMGGLWEQYNIEEVASPVAWRQNPQLVLDFYNIRRKQLMEVEPNAGHYALARLEEKYDVEIITQNVDNLHERAGSSKVLHLHGELMKVRSEVNDDLIYELDHWELKLGDKAEDGHQLRPHIVWFGEAVPMMEAAYPIVQQADIFMVIGTSLHVYPAAGLTAYAPSGIPKYYIDPNAHTMQDKAFRRIAQKSGEALPKLVEELLEQT